MEFSAVHNAHHQGYKAYTSIDPHLQALSQLKYQYHYTWWRALAPKEPGIYILTGGRQIGKSTSCKQFIAHCVENEDYAAENIFYLPCDTVYTAQELSNIIQLFIDSTTSRSFLLIIDEITFVPHWQRCIKAFADAGLFQEAICILTGSDTLILKEAAMSFPGRRGNAAQTDFHLYPLSFYQYATLVEPNMVATDTKLQVLFDNYLCCGGYLRAINDLAVQGEINQATYLTYEQWIRGDFAKQGKNDTTLLALLDGLLTNGVSQVSYSTLTNNIGLISKETCIQYCHLLERMDVIFELAAFDQNKRQGFPRKDRKFHFLDPFIQRTVSRCLEREGLNRSPIKESFLVEACVASHCKRLGRAFYFKGSGEVDVIWLHKNQVLALEVKWANQIRANDLKMLKQFSQATLLRKPPGDGHIEGIRATPVYRFLYEMTE